MSEIGDDDGVECRGTRKTPERRFIHVDAVWVVVKRTGGKAAQFPMFASWATQSFCIARISRFSFAAASKHTQAVRFSKACGALPEKESHSLRKPLIHNLSARGTYAQVFAGFELSLNKLSQQVSHRW